MSSTALVAVLVMFVALQVGAWYATCWFFAFAGGWRSLAKRFPHPGHRDIGDHAAGLLTIDERWNAQVVVHADADGLAVGPARPIVPGHPTMLFPWDAIRPVPTRSSFVLHSTRIAVDDATFNFFGKAADFVDRSLRQYRAT